MMKLRPSEIFFSQDSIANTWGKYTPFNGKSIGDTLDDLLTESISPTDIPNISVVMKNGSFYTADNRRLWVFRKAEELEFLQEIEVDEIPMRLFRKKKFTTTNDGISIKIRGYGDPGGDTWKTWEPNTFLDLKENTVSESAFHANESEANIFKYSLCTKKVAEVNHSSKYKSSYSSNYSLEPTFRFENNFVRNSDFPVSDKEIHLSSTTTTSNEKATQCSKYSLEPNASKTSLVVQEPQTEPLKTDDIPDTYCFNEATPSERPCQYKSPYREYQYSRSNVGTGNTFSKKKMDSQLTDQNIKLQKVGPKSKEEAKTYSEPSALRQTSLPGKLPHDNRSRTDINQDDFRTVSDVNRSNILRSHRKDHTIIPTFETDKTFTNNLGHQALDTGIQLSTIKTKFKGGSTMHSESSFESTSNKTSSLVHQPHPDTIRTKVSKDSSCNKTFTEDERQSKDKSSYRKFVFDDALPSNLKSEMSDQEIERLSIKTKPKEEETTCSNDSNRLTLSKFSLRVQGPHAHNSKTGVIQNSYYNNPVIVGKRPSTLKSQNGHTHSSGHSFVTDNEFTTNFKSQVPDEEFQVSTPHHYNINRAEDIKDSSCNTPYIETDRLSKSPYIKSLSARACVVSDNTLVNNLKSQEPDQEIEFSSNSMKVKPRRESTTFSSSFFGVHLGKTLLPAQRPYAFISSTDNRDDSTCIQTITEADKQSKDKSLYTRYCPARPYFVCDNTFKSNLDSQVPDQQIVISNENKNSKEEAPNGSDYSLESAKSKISLRVQGPHAYKSRISGFQDSYSNRPVTEAERASILKSPHEKNLSSMSRIVTDSAYTTNWNPQIHDKGIQRSKIKPKYEAEETACREPLIDSALSKTSLREQIPHYDTKGIDAIEDSSRTKSFTASKCQNKDKSSKRMIFSTRPNRVYDNSFESNIESQQEPNQHIEFSRITNKSKIEEEATLSNDSSVQSTFSKMLYRDNTNGIDSNKDYSCNKYFTEAEHQSRDKTSYRKYCSAKPKSTEKATTCGESTFKSSLSKTSLPEKGFHAYKSRLKFIQGPNCNSPVTEAEDQRILKSPYIRN